MPDYPFTPTIAVLPDIVPFVGPEALERQRGVTIRARIGANESVFGPSPRAVAAMVEAAAESWKYGDPENHDLKAVLAAHHGVRHENIAVGEGIDGLTGTLVRLFVEPGVPIATSAGAYPTFNYHVAGCGGRLVMAPFNGDHEDPVALMALAKSERARLIYFVNPDNPMGTWVGRDPVQRLIEAVPAGSLLVLDEAYADFLPASDLPDIDPADTRVLRLRTFSKAHGLAGARVGYAIGEAKLCAAFNKIRNHFGMTRISQLGAIAALGDPEYLADVVRKVAASRDRIAEIARASGLRTIPSATNFVAVDCGRDGAYAKQVLDGLIARGVFVRMPGVAPLNRCIRISVGTDADLRVFEEALPTALADASRPA